MDSDKCGYQTPTHIYRPDKIAFLIQFKTSFVVPSAAIICVPVPKFISMVPENRAEILTLSGTATFKKWISRKYSQ